MRIATWNLDHVRPGGRRTQRIRDAINWVGADVWVLTETHREFSPGESYVSWASSVEAQDRPQGECWVSIWVRRGISAAPLRLFGEPQRSAAVRITGVSGRDLAVFGTVLPWRGDCVSSVRGATRFEEAVSWQQRDWLALTNEADLCIAGDFNQELSAGGPVGTKRGMAVLNAVLASHSLVCLTANASDPLLQRGWRTSIDHILVSKRLAKNASVVATWPEEHPLPSGMPDHYGVCAALGNS